MADITGLKGLLSEDLYNQIDTALKDSKAKFADLSTGSYVGKEKFDAQAAEITNLKTQTQEANKQIENFKTMDPEGLRKSVDEYKTKYEESTAAHAKQLEDMQYNTELGNALKAAKAKNPKAVEALLNKETLKFAEGKIIGLDEQLKALKVSDEYQFETEGTPPPSFINTGGDRTTKPIEDTALRSSMGLPPTK